MTLNMHLTYSCPAHFWILHGIGTYYEQNKLVPIAQIRGVVGSVGNGGDIVVGIVIFKA
jgi:hypothetical protein